MHLRGKDVEAKHAKKHAPTQMDAMMYGAKKLFSSGQDDGGRRAWSADVPSD